MRKLFTSFGNMSFLIAPYWRHGKLYLAGRITLPLIFAPALALLDVSMIQTIINNISGGAAISEVIIAAAVFVGLKFALTVLRWTFLLLYDRWKAEELRIKINRSIYEQIAKTDYKYFDNPEFYNSFTFAASELATKSAAALNTLTNVLEAITVIMAMTVYLSTLSPWIILISAAAQAICLFAQRIIMKLGIKRNLESLPFGRRLDYVHRIAYQKQFAADMKSTALPQKLLGMFDVNGVKRVGVWKKYAVPFTWANMLQFTASYLCEFVQLAYIVFIVFMRNIGIGMIAGMFTAVNKLNNQLNRFVALYGDILEISLYTERIQTFFNYTSDIEPNQAGLQPPSAAFGITLHDISFSYPNSNFALNKISLTVNPGEKIAIVGENGVGKTTLSKLLLRLYNADSGEIKYNGTPIQDYNIHKLRKKIGVAFQEPQIYALTVRENMELYNTADDDILRQALGKAGLNIELNSEITREFDESGVMLSGGQVQKLGLARLLHGSFGLLLLDEPSSALDPLAEYEITKLIFEQSRTTTIMVAHRLSTIRNADRIYLLDNGGIAECGQHDELMAYGGKYADMFNKQAENYVSGI